MLQLKMSIMFAHNFPYIRIRYRFVYWMSYSDWSEINAFMPLYVCFGYISRKVQENWDWKWMGHIHLCFVLIMWFLWWKHIKKIIRRTAKVLFDCIKEVLVEEHTEKSNSYVYVCSPECRTKLWYRDRYNKLKLYFWRNISILKLENASYHWVKNSSSSHLLSNSSLGLQYTKQKHCSTWLLLLVLGYSYIFKYWLWKEKLSLSPIVFDWQEL